MSELSNYSLDAKSWLDIEIKIGDGQSKYAHMMVELWKKGTKAYLDLKLRNKNASQNARIALEDAMVYDLTKIAFPLAVELMKYYTYLGEKTKTEKYQKIVDSIQSDLNAETKAEYSLIEIDKQIIKKLSHEFILNQLDVFIQEIDKILYQFETLDFLLFAYKLKLRKAQILNSEKAIISLCEEAMNRFENKSYDLPHVVYFFFMNPAIPLLIENRDFEGANKLIQYLKGKLKEKKNNWFTIHSYEVILNFRKLDFERAGKLIDEVRKSDNKVHFERYRIYDAYCSLFSNRHFRLGKFTNEVFEHNKDREGYRISIVIIGLLHLLKYRKYDFYIDRVNAIEHYMYKYLKSTSKRVVRSRYFLKCLIMIPKCNFNKIAFKRKTAPLFEKLMATPKSDTNQLLEQEPVTYEHLYFFVEGLLK